MGRKKKSQNIETFFLLRERIKRIWPYSFLLSLWEMSILDPQLSHLYLWGQPCNFFLGLGGEDLNTSGWPEVLFKTSESSSIPIGESWKDSSLLGSRYLCKQWSIWRAGESGVELCEEQMMGREPWWAGTGRETGTTGVAMRTVSNHLLNKSETLSLSCPEAVVWIPQL